MSEADTPDLEVAPDAVLGAPQTGEAAVDEALMGLAELSSAPLSQHHDRLAQAHERLHQALNGDGPDSR